MTEGDTPVDQKHDVLNNNQLTSYDRIASTIKFKSAKSASFARVTQPVIGLPYGHTVKVQY